MDDGGGWNHRALRAGVGEIQLINLAQFSQCSGVGSLKRLQLAVDFVIDRVVQFEKQVFE